MTTTERENNRAKVTSSVLINLKREKSTKTKKGICGNMLRHYLHLNAEILTSVVFHEDSKCRKLLP